MPTQVASEPLDFGVLLNVAFGAFKQQLHRHLSQAGRVALVRVRRVVCREHLGGQQAVNAYHSLWDPSRA